MTDIPDSVWRPMLASALRSGAKTFAVAHADDIESWIAGFDFAVAVWPNEKDPLGFSCLPIKGYERWCASEPGLRATAIPLCSYPEARVLLGRFGNPAWFDDPKPVLRLVAREGELVES